MDTFHERLRWWLENKYGSIRAGAVATGIFEGQLTKYVLNYSTPRLPAMEQLCRAGLNISWLLTGEGNPNITPELLHVAETVARYDVNKDRTHELYRMAEMAEQLRDGLREMAGETI